jgi:putative endonuclease
MRSHNYWVYIAASRSRVLYVGVTNDLARRMHAHRHKLLPGFTARCNVDRLVYMEHTHAIEAAIGREKQIKGWTRAKKIELIESVNADWADLALTAGR